MVYYFSFIAPNSSYHQRLLQRQTGKKDVLLENVADAPPLLFAQASSIECNRTGSGLSSSTEQV